MLRRPVARAGRRGLIGTAATTAVVVGTATAVSGHVARKQADKAQDAANAQAAQQQAAAQQAAAQQAAAPPAEAPPPPPPPAAPETDVLAQLTQLAALKEQGVLTEAEFEAQKAKILAS